MPMATNQLRQIIQTLHRAALHQDAAGLTDGQLLENYLATREEAAFAALVHRHGPMVWGVCRRVLGSHHDAEDAFQATFLVLVRKAASVVSKELVANWLYGVAHQTALKARATIAKRRGREKQVTAMPEPEAVPQKLWESLQSLLDRELSRLPDKYRAVIVLCDLEGKTRKEAARHFSVPEGTVASRLATARAMLGRRLARHGKGVSGGVLAAVLAQGAASAAVPAGVASRTVQAAGTYAARQAAVGALSVRAVALAEGVLKAMLLSKLKMATALLVAVASFGVAATFFARHVPEEKRTGQSVQQIRGRADRPVQEKKDREKDDLAVNGVWPQWRGPDRDGVVHGVAVPKKWPKTLTEEWRVTVGKGVASPVVAGGRVYVFTRRKDDQEVVRCLDLAGGKEIWRSQPCPAPYQVGGGEGTADDRPRSTPVVAGSRVFTLGMTGILSCLDARTGQLLWRRDTGYLPYMGTSPLVTDSLCIVHVAAAKRGGLTAFDARTGAVKWCHSEGPSPMSASPILVTLAGERQVVSYYHGNLIGVSPATGKKLWSAPSAPGANITPLRYKDLLIFAAGDRMDPLRAVRLEKGAQGIAVKDVWKAKGHPSYYSSPVFAGDCLFGMAVTRGGHFFCLNAKTGVTLWEGPARMGRTDRPEGHASLLRAHGMLLLLTDRGRLLVVKASGKAYEPMAEYRLCDSQTNAHPVFLGDRILIKDDTTLRSFRLGPR
jgi:RNA polymerase sigma factor (sigma-70 family)